jgi:ABC-type phosphate/phosphonate transport system ATPase subunit
MTGPDAPAALRATGLGFRYRARGGWPLRDCEFTVPGGRVAALVGRNGAGKSTLLHLAGGLLRPRTGEIQVLDAAPGTPEARALAARHTVVHRRAGGRQLTALVRQQGPLRGDWHVERPRLEDILIGYLHADDTVRPTDAELTEAAA